MNKTVEIFLRFFLLGSYSFGGPAAHMGYFYKHFVEKLKWINENTYSQLIGLSQFLPGPGSSQLGFAIGLRRNGLAGGIAAFLGFTLPSFILMTVLALVSTTDSFHSQYSGIIHGLKILAVVVVADACWSMFSKFCTTKFYITLAIGSMATLLLLQGIGTQIGILIAAAIIGYLGPKETNKENSISNLSKPKTKPFIIFLSLLIALPVLGHFSPIVNLTSQFYHSGSYVFGGGHVVLPILQETVGKSLTNEEFLVGYAAAQAVPGPMFTLATYLGAMAIPTHPLFGATLATIAIFLPGFLLVVAFQKSWLNFISNPNIHGVSAAINASVVGILLAALYSPVCTSAIFSGKEMALAALGIYALKCFKIHIFYLVGSYILIGHLAL